MSIGTWVVVAITFKQVDHAPYRKARPKRNNKYLQSVDCRCKKCHIIVRNGILFWFYKAAYRLKPNKICHLHSRSSKTTARFRPSSFPFLFFPWLPGFQYPCPGGEWIRTSTGCLLPACKRAAFLLSESGPISCSIFSFHVPADTRRPPAMPFPLIIQGLPSPGTSQSAPLPPPAPAGYCRTPAQA